MHILVAMIDHDAFNGEMLLSTVLGLVVGAITSLIVNIALVEISLSSFFAVVSIFPSLNLSITMILVLWSLFHHIWWSSCS